MQSHDWQSEQPTLVRILQVRLGNKETCIDVVNGYEELMQAIWTFTSRLLGDNGTRAVLVRSLQLAVKDAPLLQNVKVHEDEIDLSGLRARAQEPDCNPPKMLDALLGFAAVIFETLADLTGSTITKPLLNYIGEAGSIRE